MTVREKLASFDNLKLCKDTKEMNSGISRGTLVQQSRLDACAFKTILSGDKCTRMIVARQVGFKA